jgi:type II secretory pathway pseudopilin PulG
MRLRMQSQQPTPRQSGFSAIEVLLVVLVVAAMAGISLVVYQRHKPITAKNSAATTSTQMTTRPAQTTTQYLTIKEWGVKLPLSDSIKDAYYTVGGNVGTDGLPNTIWLGLTSLNSSGCNASPDNPSSFKPLGAIVRVLPIDKDPGTGKLYTQQDPNGTTINSYYYGYASNISKVSCASATTLQSIDSALATAAKGIVTASATKYLDIKEWGVHMTLDSTTASMYYYIKPNLPNVVYLSLKTVSTIAPDCAADKISLGAIVRETPAEQQSAPDAQNSIKGTIHIGNYWYGFSKSPAVCVINASQDAAISQALPNYSLQELINTFNTLAAD